MPFYCTAMKINRLNELVSNAHTSELMPMLFVGHGSPMNAIEENEYVQGWQKISQEIPKPTAILCISAHWETRGTFVTAMPSPSTIHDFGGFPRALFEVQYPAPGSPVLAHEIEKHCTQIPVLLDDKWGLDHGSWSILKRMYPLADVPVLQMSLDFTQAPQYHYELAKHLSYLRRKGVLILGSGNIVHNLGLLAWDKLAEPEYAYDWAMEVNESVKQYVTNENYTPLLNYQTQGNAFKLAIPSADHFLPMLYILGLKEKNEHLQFFNDKIIAGALSMTSFKVGA